jgi:hypothetical protein
MAGGHGFDQTARKSYPQLAQMTQMAPDGGREARSESWWAQVRLDRKEELAADGADDADGA